MSKFISVQETIFPMPPSFKSCFAPQRLYAPRHPGKSIQPFFSGGSYPHRSHRLIQGEDEKKTSIKNPTSATLMAPTDVCPRRLIDTCTIKLVEFGKNETIPPYAILSHWWIEGKEVVYEEFRNLHWWTKFKSGYRKIKAACRQARRDGIRYIWVDTCCIEQGNHDDVAANITSMYAFYQNAEVCYAYLADMGAEFETSEWFERGWTLQELLAPRTVMFFNSKWQCVGDKHELRDDIQSETTIPPEVLSGKQSITDVDVLTRMSWAIGRNTTKEQDEAYCLQGLLGVSVEPDYEESLFSSFNRLGKALFEAQPELKGRLGIEEDLFSDSDSKSFYWLLIKRFSGT
ncbi:hypothetical protein VKT23_015733 [Stygiomarasmius scandens]|uniref:Heterokaryon incompatibility domain-containing protein n=1 Tax=Marasmiellus scandens TaxID=2682957 RepID=A0ABR1IZE6_9AGAR